MTVLKFKLAAEMKLLRPLAGYTLYDHKITTP